MWQFAHTYSTYFHHHHALIAILIVLALWEIAWKAIGLWHAARAGHMAWFIVMFIINSVGILPILFLLFANDKVVKTSKNYR